MSKTKCGGIYFYTNEADSKLYVGQTYNRKKRHHTHTKASLNNPLHNAIRKYGITNFSYHWVPVKNTQLRNTMEAFAIDVLQTKAPNGYNLADGHIGNTEIDRLTVDEVISLFKRKDIINAAELCKRYNQQPNDFICKSSTINLINKLQASHKNNQTIVRTQRGGKYKERGTWIHHKLLHSLLTWLDPVLMTEVMDKLVENK